MPRDPRIDWQIGDVRDVDLAQYDVIACLGLFYHLTIEDQRDLQHAFVAATEQRQGTVRGHRGNRLGKVEPVAELGAFRFLAVDDGRPDATVFAEVSAQPTEQFGVFGEFFHEDLAGAVEDGLGVGETGIDVDELFGFVVGRQVWIFQQAKRQRLNASFAGDLGVGAAFLLIRQIQVFEALLGFGIADFSR